MEIRWTDQSGNISLESDSNSIASIFAILSAITSTLEQRLEKTDASTWGVLDKEALEYLQEEAQMMSEQLSHIDSQADNFKSETDLKWYYEDLHVREVKPKKVKGEK